MVATKGSDSRTFPATDENRIIELSLMMSRRQFDAMEHQACAYGMSVAQYLRRLVQENIDQEQFAG